MRPEAPSHTAAAASRLRRLCGAYVRETLSNLLWCAWEPYIHGILKERLLQEGLGLVHLPAEPEQPGQFYRIDERTGKRVAFWRPRDGPDATSAAAAATVADWEEPPVCNGTELLAYVTRGATRLGHALAQSGAAAAGAAAAARGYASQAALLQLAHHSLSSAQLALLVGGDMQKEATVDPARWTSLLRPHAHCAG